jgi:hypothetical protein
MSTKNISLRFVVVLFALGLFTGCESTDGGGGNVSGSVYYGVGFYDPWYYGDYDHDHDIVVTPPNRPDRPGQPDRPVRPEQPIARPPSASTQATPAYSQPAARQFPSIPSTPRPSPGGGGGGRR